MSTVSVAGVERQLQPLDGARAVLVSQLVKDAARKIQRTIATVQELNYLQMMPPLDEAMLADEGMQKVLDTLGVSEEERVPGLTLEHYANPTNNIGFVLDVAVEEVPEDCFNIAAAMLIHNSVFSKHASGSGGQKLKKLVQSAANDLKFGNEANNWKGASIKEVLTIVGLAVAEAREEVTESVPLALETFRKMVGAPEIEETPELESVDTSMPTETIPTTPGE